MVNLDNPPPLKINLLGRFQVQRGDTLIDEEAWTRRKVQMLLKLLAVSPEHRRHKEQIFDFLWPELDLDAAANNLHKTLYRLRHILCPEASGARDCPYVAFDGQMVSLEMVEADADQFEAAAHDAREEDDLEALRTAISVYQGPLLPEDLYVEWTIARREHLRRTYVALRHQLVEHFLEQREYGKAISHLEALLAADRVAEETHRLLMQAYALNGQRHRALRQYQRCRQELGEELGVDPSPETTALYNAILDGTLRPKPAVAPALSLPPARYSLVGRRREQGRILRLLANVESSGRPHLVLLRGEAGVGKTRLAHAVARRTVEQGHPVLAGAAYDPVGTLQELPLPYAPLTGALRHFLEEQIVEVREQLVGARATALAPLLPELSEDREMAGADPKAIQDRLFDAVAYVLRRIAGSQPLLLLLDDFHATDQATVELIGYLLHRTPPIPLLVLALVRDDGPRLPAPLSNLLIRLSRANSLSEITLFPLDEEETAQLAAEYLGGRVEDSVVHSVQQSGEGNPLFTEQLLQSWREEGLIRQENGCWQFSTPDEPKPLPQNLRQTIQSRVNRLSPEVQKVLQVAAAAGREFPYRWLAETGLWQTSTLLQRLDQALQSGILEEVTQRSGPLLYRFQHGLLRQAMYENLSETRQRYLHLQLAETLENMPEVAASIRSRHWFAAGRWPWAFCYALTAADEALHAFAHTEAVSLYDRALAAARGSWQVDTEWLVRAHTGRAQALMGLNRFNDAVSDWLWLVEQARADNNRAAEGRALSQLATAYFWGHNLELAGEHAQEALTIAEETDDATTATMSTSNLGCIALCTGDLHQGARQLEEVLKRSQDIGDPQMIVEALACLPGAYHWQGDSDRALPLLEKGISLAREEGLGFWLGNLLFFAGLARGALGHYERALDYFEQGQRHSHESGDMFTAVRVVNSFGWIYRELYDLEAAVAWDRKGVEMAREFPWPEPLANALVNLGADYLAVGEPMQAEEALADAEALLDDDKWMRWRWHTRLLVCRGRLALSRGALEAAKEHGHAALALARETSARKNMARAHYLLGTVRLAAGENHRAKSELQQAVEYAQDVSNPRLHWQSLDALARAYGKLGGEKRAVRLWREAGDVIQETAAGLTGEQFRRTYLQADSIRAIRRRLEDK